MATRGQVPSVLMIKAKKKADFERFLNRLRILRSLDLDDVRLCNDDASVTSWLKFRDDPSEYLISCPPDEAEHIWTALRKREE